MSVDLADLRTKKITALVHLAQDLGVDNAANLRKQELIFEIVRLRAGTGGARGMGILEKLPDGFGFLRSPDCNYLPGPDDIYVSPSQIRRFNLRTGGGQHYLWEYPEARKPMLISNPCTGMKGFAALSRAINLRAYHWSCNLSVRLSRLPGRVAYE